VSHAFSRKNSTIIQNTPLMKSAITKRHLAMEPP
jgi:hypothetical protein